MPLPHERLYTIKDIYDLPESTRAELIDGQIYYQAAPSRSHQRIIIELATIINNHIKAHSGRCEINIAPFAVFLNNDDENYVEPDISVTCDPSKLDDKGCHGAPDWIIEVVSPSNSSYDYVFKLNKYMTAGVREYWIINPDNQTATVYFFEGGKFAQHYTFDDKVKVNIYEDLYADFRDIIQSISL